MASALTDVAPACDSLVATGAGPVVEAAALELGPLQKDLLRAISADANREAVMASVSVLLQAAINPVAMQYQVRDHQRQLTVSWQQPAGSSQTLSRAHQAELLHCGNTACARGQLQISRLGDGTALQALAVPVFLRKQAPEALVLVLPTTARPLERAIVILQMVASHMTLWYVLQESTRSERDAHTAAALLEVIERLGACDDLRHACYTLVGELKEHLGWDEVALGLCQGRKQECRLHVISGRAQFDRNSHHARAFEAALDESVLRGSLAEWPPPAATPGHSTRALQHLCSLSGSRFAVSAPLLDENQQPVAAWLFLAQEDVAERARTVHFLQASAGPVGSALDLLRRAERGRLVRGVRWLQANHRGWRARGVLLAAGLLAAVLALPLQYKVGCDCEVQPVTRRYVAAPFDGRLEKALVAPGAVIGAGAVLARMDGRDLRCELAGLVAEHGRAAKRRDAAMATHDVVAAQLARLEMEKLESNIKMLEHRAENLAIKSPIDGMVVTGDQQRAEGAPLSVGQALFEIAPLDQMIVELAIPEDEINYVADGRAVEIRLDAFPRRVWHGTLGQVHPRSEQRDERNVFIAEVPLDNPDDLLRPGMNGRAKVLTGRRPLAWNLFHKPCEYLLTALGW